MLAAAVHNLRASAPQTGWPLANSCGQRRGSHPLATSPASPAASSAQDGDDRRDVVDATAGVVRAEAPVGERGGGGAARNRRPPSATLTAVLARQRGVNPQRSRAACERYSERLATPPATEDCREEGSSMK